MIDEPLNRRTLFTGGALAAAALALPSSVAAAKAAPDWTLGVADVPGDIAPQRLQRLHGRLPADLHGVLYRNGPARFRRGGTASGHWFDGDGLIRAWTIGDGGASLAARFVDTPKRAQEEKLGRMAVPGFGTAAGPGIAIGSNDDTNAANTAIIHAGDRMLALWEAGSPFAIDPLTLATRGAETLRSDLAHMPFLAHPRVEPDGRIWNLGMSGKSAFVWRLSARGTMEDGTLIKLPRASYVHDFTATARHLVIVLQPWIQDGFALPFVDSLAWRPEQGTQVLVVDKGDLTRQRLYELPAFAFFHLGDAWEESDGTIRFDGCFETSPVFGAQSARALVAGRHIVAPQPILTMVALHPDGRAGMTASPIDAEFPRSDPRVAGLKRSKTVHVGRYDRNRPFARGVGVWDWATGKDDSFDFGARQLVEEFIPVGAWLLGTTVNLDARATELHVLNARNVAAGPVTSWRADVALPVGFHGNFVARA